MKNIYIILSDNPELAKKAGTIEIKAKNEEESSISQSIPIKQTYGLIIMNECSLTSQFASLLKQEQIPLALTYPDGTPLGCFKPFGRTTSKTLFTWYKMLRYNNHKTLTLQQTIAKTAIISKINAAKFEEESINEDFSQKIDELIKKIDTTKHEAEIIKILEEFQRIRGIEEEAPSNMIPDPVRKFLTGQLYGLLEISVFHAQLDSGCGIFLTRDRPQLLPLIADLMLIYEPIYLHHFYSSCIKNRSDEGLQSNNPLPLATKRRITQKFLEYIEKSHYIKSLNRPVRLLELPKLQLYRWIRYANGIEDDPSVISLKSLFR